MAIKIEVADKKALSRQDTFRANPNDVKVGRNSRMIPAPNYAETVLARALSIAKHGQLQPCEATPNEDNTLTLVSGYTRRDAVLLLREGFTAIDPDTGEKAEFHDANATLWIKVVDVDQDEAFLRGISENVQRRDTTDLQEALAQAELRSTMGWTDSKIARFYGYKNQNRVASLSKLLTLDKDTQTRVHNGKLALYTALDTLELDPETRATLLDGATDETGKVQGAVLRNLIRDLYEKKGTLPAGEEPAAEPAAEPKLRPAGEGVEDDEEEGEDPKARKFLPRTRKELERVLAERTGDTESTKLTTASQELLDVVILYLKGRRTDDYLVGALNDYTK